MKKCLIRASSYALLGAMSACVVLVFGSCASLAKPKGPTDTLLVIPVNFVTKAGAQGWIWYYSLDLGGLPDPVIVSPTVKHYIAIAGLPAGDYPLTGINLVPIRTNNYQNSQPLHNSTPSAFFHVKERTATLAPFVLEATLEEVKPGWFSQQYQFRNIEDQHMQILRDELAKEGNFSAWEDGLRE
jgi:hypothetical protein